MTPRRPPDPADAPASPALGAFLRGVERRGLVFAWLLAGSGESGVQALEWARGRFGREAGRVPFGDWARHFWALLLAAPALRQPPAMPHWEPGFEWLSRIGHGPRAALLLRLVAGLAESDAAVVLGIARPTYRLGLQRALPRAADGSADVAAWEALGEAVQAWLRDPGLQQAASARPAEAAAAPNDDAARPQAAGGRRPAGRGVRAALWLVALLTLAGLGATFLPFDRLPEGLAQAPDRVLSEPLPPAEAPVARYDEDQALALHPDLGLLLDALAGGAAAADPAFHAWLAAEDAAAGSAVADSADPAADGPSGPTPEVAAATVAADAGAAAEADAALPPAQRLAGLDPAARHRLELQRERWDALPHAERGELRERWLAWRDLSAGERAALRAAALRFADRAPAEQAGLRARFDALDASQRHGWLLGPDLGADYPRLHPLIAQVPMDARTALLEALRGLDAAERDDLAVLAARTPPQARAALRVELLAVPAGERGRWLRGRVSPSR